MTGFLMTLASLCGVMFTLPEWNHSKKWGYKPFAVMCLVAIVMGVLWATERI